MKELIKDYMSSRNIKYYTVLPYESCREINRGIIERESFSPKSVILFLVPYNAGATVNLSIYSASYDYHLILKEISDGLGELIHRHIPDASYKGYGDHSPIDEVNAALIGGLGIKGDNGLIINETYGSYVFIGDLITDIEPQLLGEGKVGKIKKCEGCGRCKAACPTGILRLEGSDCLSAITQKKGELSEREVSLMREYNTVWGCDICQKVCPYNENAEPTPLSFFYKDRIPCLDSVILDSMDKQAFSLRAFAWRGRKTVKRNLDALGY